jgi:hypothetical protein
MKKNILILIVLLVGSLNMMVCAQEENPTSSDTLVVVWTSGDFEVAEKMVYMYVLNAKRADWFDEVIFIVWGPSAKLLSENEKLQESLDEMKSEGIILEACIACANMYGVADDLRKMEIDVKGMGSVLSDYLKKGYKVMTF